MTLRELRLRALGFLLLSMSLGAAPEAPAPAAKRPDPIRDPVCVGWNEGWVVYRYSPTQNQWLMWTSPNSPKPVTALSAVGSHHAAVVDPRKQCSGWTFNLHTQKWEQIPPSPFGGPPGATATVMITFIDDKLLAWGQPGGGKQGGIFDTATKQWNPMAVSPVPSRFRAATAKFGGKWLVWGGYGHNNPDKPRAFGALADGALYDIDKNAWEIIPGPPAPMPNYGYVWATWNDSLIVFGGRTGRAISRVGAIYDTTSKTWEAIVECPFEVGHQSTAMVHKDRLLLWSGASPAAAAAGKTAYSTDAAVYDLIKKQWQKLPEAPADPRLLAFTQVHGDEIIMWGGWISGDRGGTFLRDGVAYDMAKGVWRTIPPLPGPVPSALHPGW